MYSFMVIKWYGRFEEVVGMVVWFVGLEVFFVIGVMYIIDGVFGVWWLGEYYMVVVYVLVIVLEVVYVRKYL